MTIDTSQRPPAFTLDAERMFRAMSVATTATRDCLRGVRIEPLDGGGVLMIATNGDAMLIQRDREGHADHAATLAVAASMKEPIEMEDGEIFESSISWSGAKICIAALEPGETVAAPTVRQTDYPGPHVLVERRGAEYPTWRGGLKCIKDPLYEDERPGSIFDPKLLALLTDGRVAVRLHGTPVNSGWFVTYHDDPDSLGAIMKCKVLAQKPSLADMLTAIGRGDLIGNATRADEVAQ